MTLLKGVFLGDARFQARHGFYFLYAIFVLLYVVILGRLPADWRQTGAALFVFTDPAAMGLFFMGAIVLFEKSQRVLESLAVSPVTPEIYVVSKTLSLLVIALASALIIALSAGAIANVPDFIAGVALANIIFTLVSLAIAARVKTLNQFMLAVVPAEIVICLPAILYLFGVEFPLMWLHPGVCSIALIMSAPNANPMLCVLCLVCWCAVSAFLAVRSVRKMFIRLGGVKL